LTDGTSTVNLVWRDQTMCPMGNPVVEIRGKAMAGNQLEVESVVEFSESKELGFDVQGYSKILKVYRETCS
jgi:hypothetical protein